MYTNTYIRTSIVAKLDGIKSWSLEARKTCPAAWDSVKKDWADVCKDCYAVGGNYRFPNVKEPRAMNKVDWKRADWVADMVAEISANSLYWRWFDSGDLYKVELAEKIYQVMLQTPQVKHWLPTRSYLIKGFKEICDKMQALPNVQLRFSSDSVVGKYTKGLHRSVVGTRDVLESHSDITICSAYAKNPDKPKDVRCNGCRACWTDVAVIGYVAHGKNMTARLAKQAANALAIAEYNLANPHDLIAV